MRRTISSRYEVVFAYQDADVVVVNKPAKVVVHETRGAIGRPLLQRVRDALGGEHVWPLHRLDAATSGAIAFAKNKRVASQLGPLFAEGAVRKQYIALVRGVPPESGVIDHPIQRDGDGPRVPARTDFRRLWTTGRYSLVLTEPHTGRRHQIRRHLKHRSWPIIGDVRYGKGEHNRFFRFNFGLDRLALHASALAFEFSDTLRVDVSVPLPSDLRTPLLRLGAPEHLLDSCSNRGMTVSSGARIRSNAKEDCNPAEPED